MRVRGLKEAIEFSNGYAHEHLIVSVADAERHGFFSHSGSLSLPLKQDWAGDAHIYCLRFPFPFAQVAVKIISKKRLEASYKKKERDRREREKRAEKKKQEKLKKEQELIKQGKIPNAPPLPTALTAEEKRQLKVDKAVSSSRLIRGSVIMILGPGDVRLCSVA